MGNRVPCCTCNSCPRGASQSSELLVCVFLLSKQYILIQNFVHGYCYAVWLSFFFFHPGSGIAG